MRGAETALEAPSVDGSPGTAGDAAVTLSTTRAPCIAADSSGQHCVLGLLLGVACCPDGDCSQCQETGERMRRSGFSLAAVARSHARSRRGLLAVCPTCGCPPPPAPDVMPPLPRLDRSTKVLSGSPCCRICGASLKPPKRHYCSNECWLERRRDVEGWGQNGHRRSPAGVTAHRIRRA